VLAELNWQSLAERRRLARLTMFYKIHYHLVAIDMPLTMKTRSVPHALRIQQHIIYRHLDVIIIDFPFFSRTVREWITLPEQIVSVTTIETFKNAIITV